MIYLLGIRHLLQTECDNPGPHLLAKFDRFKAFLGNVVKSTMATAIAEEFNLEIEGLKNRKSIARLMAERSYPSLLYVHCEANSEERKALGIPTAEEILERCRSEGFDEGLEHCRDSELFKYFPLREKFWMKRLQQATVDPILFLCGPNHIQTFACRLIENGIPCKILLSDWWASDEAKYGVLPLVERPI